MPAVSVVTVVDDDVVTVDVEPDDDVTTMVDPLTDFTVPVANEKLRGAARGSEPPPLPPARELAATGATGSTGATAARGTPPAVADAPVSVICCAQSGSWIRCRSR